MLPRMTAGNWFFWAVMVWIGINFVWLRFGERFVPQWVGAIIAAAIAMVLFKYGPRPKEEEEGEE